MSEVNVIKINPIDNVKEVNVINEIEVSTNVTPSTTSKDIDGDLSVAHDLSVGGKVKVEGGGLIKGDLRVTGRLIASGLVSGDDETLQYLDELNDKVVNLDSQIEEFQGETENELNNIKAVLDELTYVAPVISSFSITNPNREVGDSVSSLTFNWAVNKQGLSLSINQGIGKVSGTSITKTLDTPLTSKITFTLSASDDKNTTTKNATLSFLMRAFWFVDKNDSVTEATILSASNSALVSSRAMTKMFNCSGGKYIYICIPTNLCSGTVGFTAFGLATSFVLTQFTKFKNQYGAVVPMNVYRSLELQNGSNIEIKVS